MVSAELASPEHSSEAVAVRLHLGPVAAPDALTLSRYVGAMIGVDATAVPFLLVRLAVVAARLL